MFGLAYLGLSIDISTCETVCDSLWKRVALGWHCGWWHWPTTMSQVYKKNLMKEREKKPLVTCPW